MDIDYAFTDKKTLPTDATLQEALKEYTVENLIQ